MSDTTLQASVVDRTLKFRHQRSVNDTLQCFDSWILLKMLGPRDKAEFVRQEAYDRSYTRPIIRIYAKKTHSDVISEHAWRGSLVVDRPTLLSTSTTYYSYPDVFKYPSFKCHAARGADERKSLKQLKFMSRTKIK